MRSRCPTSPARPEGLPARACRRTASKVSQRRARCRYTGFLFSPSMLRSYTRMKFLPVRCQSVGQIVGGEARMHAGRACSLLNSTSAPSSHCMYLRAASRCSDPASPAIQHRSALAGLLLQWHAACEFALHRRRDDRVPRAVRSTAATYPTAFT